ncbi:MAG: hypothetical protein ACK528_12825 [Alphaproteobacteria bacterium]
MGHAVGVAGDGGVVTDVGVSWGGIARLEREWDEQRRDAFHVFPQARTVAGPDRGRKRVIATALIVQICL